MNNRTRQILKKVENIMNAAEELSSEMICEEIDIRLKKIASDIPSIWFSDEMGTMTMMDDDYPEWQDDPVRFAFDFIFYNWIENKSPNIHVDKDETKAKKSASKIVKKHGKDIYEVIQLCKEIKRTNRCYGSFKLVKNSK